MERAPVKSSNIASVGHDGQDLEVEFKNGGIFRYPGVSLETFGEMMRSESVGKFFHSKIRFVIKGAKVGEAAPAEKGNGVPY